MTESITSSVVAGLGNAKSLGIKGVFLKVVEKIKKLLIFGWEKIANFFRRIKNLFTGNGFRLIDPLVKSAPQKTSYQKQKSFGMSTPPISVQNDFSAFNEASEILDKLNPEKKDEPEEIYVPVL